MHVAAEDFTWLFQNSYIHVPKRVLLFVDIGPDSIRFWNGGIWCIYWKSTEVTFCEEMI